MDAPARDRSPRLEQMPCEEVRAWKRGLEMAADREVAELRRTPIGMKFRQPTVLVNTAIRWGWPTRTPAELAEIEAVRQRWARIKRTAGV